MNKSMKLYFVIMADLSQIGHFSSALSSETKSLTPIYYLSFGIGNSSPNSRGEMKKFPLWEDLKIATMIGVSPITLHRRRVELGLEEDISF